MMASVMEMMAIFLALLLAHLLSDFPLQTNRVFRMKLQGHRGLALHVAIHMLVTALLLERYWQFWPTLLLLGVMHYGTDWLKLRYAQTPLTPGFLLDQLAHFLTLFLIVFITPSMTTYLPLWFLIPAVLLAFIPALLTLGYIWATDRCRAQTGVEGAVKWACSHLLPLSQKLGWLVITMLTAVALLVVV